MIECLQSWGHFVYSAGSEVRILADENGLIDGCNYGRTENPSKRLNENPVIIEYSIK